MPQHDVVLKLPAAAVTAEKEKLAFSLYMFYPIWELVDVLVGFDGSLRDRWKDG